MDIEDFTPFTPTVFIGAKDRTGYTATVLVVATFDIRLGAPVTPAEQQRFPLGDAYPEGAPADAASLSHASDLVPRKPRADILLQGAAYRPADQPTGSFRAGLQVGGFQKQLAVFGRRRFERGLVSASIVESEPLPSVPLTYENAFGGAGFDANPAGIGYKQDSLPLLEQPEQRIRTPADRPLPAGFGPISPDWAPRKSLAGTYQGDYLEKHWPGFPPDFDWGYFNAAPLDQQVKGYLRGDEAVVLENVHARHAVISTQLPAQRVVCLRENATGGPQIIPLVIDTLLILPDEGQLVLTWRGQTPAQSPDILEVRRFAFLVEPISAPMRDAATYHDQMLSLIAERDAEYEPEPIREDPEPPPAKPAAPSEPSPEDRELADLMARVAEIRKQAGHAPPADTDGAPDPPSLLPEAQAKLDEILAAAEADEQQEGEESAPKWSRESVIAAVKEKKSLSGADLTGLDLSAADLAGGDFSGAQMQRVDLSSAKLTGANLTGSDLEDANIGGAQLASATLDGALLIGAMANGAQLPSASLTGADLTGASLEGVDATGANAAGANWTGAMLSGARLSATDLTGADLSGARLPGADLSGAKLRGANLNEADVSAANLTDADLTEADFTDAKLSRSAFARASAADADFTEADASGASFHSANLNGAWFSSAVVDGANFTGADCTDVQLDATSAIGAKFTGAKITALRGGEGANLTGASFTGASGDGPVFEGCTVDGADFSAADMPNATFANASAKGANFEAADLPTARFDYAICSEANFADANLFEANFAGADLSRARLDRANFYGVELIDARISGLQPGGANLQMTKLERWAPKNK